MDYEIFVGDWDHGVPDVHFWEEAIRVLKPGGYLLAFGGSRTYHRLTCAIEDAGFEIRDCIMWLYGSGFPKSKNLDGGRKGWGTALKPAHEPIVMARKPLAGTVAENTHEYGTGALNIDACRIPTNGEALREGAGVIPCRHHEAKPRVMDREEGAKDGEARNGRWPANVIHDGSDEVIAAFPDAKGQQGALTGDEPSRPVKNTYGEYSGRREFAPRIEADKSAARFFYCAKASRSERNAGLEQFPDVPGGMVSNTSGQHITRRDGSAPGPTKNNHPTVKPIALMRYLCRLITPQGGTVLDPFMGSGSTGCAALSEGFSFIGIELSGEYAAIAEARCAHYAEKKTKGAA